MKHESYEKKFSINKTKESFSEWVNKPYISLSLQKKLSEANLLILPTEGLRNHNGPVFPSGSEDLLIFLKENGPENLIPEICIEEENYVEFVMHWDLILLGGMIVTIFIAPVTVNLVSEYLKNRLGIKISETNIKFDLTVEKENESFKIDYEGPAEEFKDTIMPIIENLANGDNRDNR